jgi:glycosyltransferase involved in cell wall biosynthesis
MYRIQEKKVLLLSYRLGYESLLYWDSMLENVKKHFSDLRVFTAHPSIKSKNNFVKTERKLTGFKYHQNPTKTYGKLYFFPMPLFIIDIINYKPDVIILNEFNLANFYTLFFKVFYKKTKILLLVESDPGLGNVEYKKYTVRYYLRKYISNKVDSILTNNELGSTYLNQYLNVNLTKIRQAPYLTSCPDNDFLKDKIKDNLVYFLYVGQIIERKGLMYLLEALNLLPTKVKNNIHFDIIGSGDMELSLKDFARIKKLNFVNFRGRLPYNELSVYYHNADCFVLPTLHDYRSLVGFEALQYGCSIIDSIYDGARFEVVEEGVNGYTVDPRNTEELKNAIEKIATNSDLLGKFKQNSQKISKRFTSGECNKNFIKSIEEV